MARKHDGEFMENPEMRELVRKTGARECFEVFGKYIKPDWHHSLYDMREWPEGGWPLEDNAPDDVADFLL